MLISRDHWTWCIGSSKLNLSTFCWCWKCLSSRHRFSLTDRCGCFGNPGSSFFVEKMQVDLMSGSATGSPKREVLAQTKHWLEHQHRKTAVHRWRGWKLPSYLRTTTRRSRLWVRMVRMSRPQVAFGVASSFVQWIEEHCRSSAGLHWLGCRCWCMRIDSAGFGCTPCCIAVAIVVGGESASAAFIGIPYRSCWCKRCSVPFLGSSSWVCRQDVSHMLVHHRRSSYLLRLSLVVAYRLHSDRYNRQWSVPCHINRWWLWSRRVSWLAPCRCLGIGALAATRYRRISSWSLSSGTSSSSSVVLGYWRGRSVQGYLCR